MAFDCGDAGPDASAESGEETLQVEKFCGSVKVNVKSGRAKEANVTVRQISVPGMKISVTASGETAALEMMSIAIQ
jgi:hypothetical protein